MRTTIEMDDAHHRALSALAQQRGLRGFSQLVAEALDVYLDSLGDSETTALLALEGVLDEKAGVEVRDRIAAARQTWRAS
jgi:hypothetical protein